MKLTFITIKKDYCHLSIHGKSYSSSFAVFAGNSKVILVFFFSFPLYLKAEIDEDNILKHIFQKNEAGKVFTKA